MFDKPLYHVIFVPPLKVVYCPVPKAACTTWKTYLRRELGLPDMGEESLIHGRQINGFTYANAIEREDLIRYLFVKQVGYFKFTVCRNPYDRLRAAYHDLVHCSEDSLPRGGKSVDALTLIFCRAFDRRPSAVRSLNFDQFIRAIGASDPASLDRHWQVQATLTCSHFIRYDAVLKFEEMENGAEPLRRRFGGKHEMDMHLNKGKKTSIDLGFSAKMKAIVQQVYARDFVRFNYDPDQIPAQT